LPARTKSEDRGGMRLSLWRIADRCSRCIVTRRGSARAALLIIGLISLILLALHPSIAFANPPRPPWHPGAPWSPITNPGSAEAHQISELFWIMLIISGVVFAGVTGVLLISIVRFSARPGADEPRQVLGSRRIEILWTLIPSVILAIAFGATVKAMKDINSPSGSAFDVHAIGHQWWWEFQYPQYGITTANELHVPTGVTIHFHVTSNDVIHSFWVPQLQRQIDANPKLDNAVFAEFNSPGTYAGACYEYCGEAHAWMKFEEVVETPGQFKAWVASERVTPPAPTGLAAAGLKVFLANTCVNCHAVSGTAAGGAVGPNLTHLASRWTVGAGAANMTEQDIENWIHDPTTYKPGVVMPGYPFLSKQDLHALGTYLFSLK
jgi:cytochrome c oxidase subunit 2